MANKSGLRIDAKQIEKGLTALNSKTEKALQMYAELTAIKMQNYAKANAPWTDRTGDARARLHGWSAAYKAGIYHGYRAYVAHGVDYGLWLEVANDELYAILDETVEAIGEEVMPGLTNLLNRLESKRKGN